jgi:hypothetical protein
MWQKSNLFYIGTFLGLTIALCNCVRTRLPKRLLQNCKQPPAIFFKQRKVVKYLTQLLASLS